MKPIRDIALLEYFNIHRAMVDKESFYSYTVKRPKCPQNFNESNCFDIATIDEYNIHEYLNATDVDDANERKVERNKRFVFLYGETVKNLKAFCYHIDYINNIDPFTSIYTECSKQNQTFKNARNMVLNKPILRIDLTSPVYLYLHDFIREFKTNERVFLILPRIVDGKQIVVERTASYGALDNVAQAGAYMSADHCQDGTSKKMYNIYPCDDTLLSKLLSPKKSSSKSPRKSPKKTSSKSSRKSPKKSSNKSPRKSSKKSSNKSSRKSPKKSSNKSSRKSPKKSSRRLSRRSSLSSQRNRRISRSRVIRKLIDSTKSRSLRKREKSKRERSQKSSRQKNVYK